MEDTVVGAFTRQRQEQLRVSLQQLNGVKVLDFRIYYQDEGGAWRPSPRGFSLTKAEWPQLREVLVKLSKALKGDDNGGADGV
ncbi:MAG: transcriptional coactivator p15/PC4 family protein [Candidatus Tectomicrobia bacterium]|nr:transcriptional coactivator p15/PC4 family protein [Candidatus Tectomicrobia bacterium]